MRDLYFDRAGQPITSAEWNVKFSDKAYKRVAWTETATGSISTVWLGLDHGYGQQRPLIFETMVFPEQDCERYSTEAEALAGHAAFVKKYSGPNKSVGREGEF